MQTTRSVPHGGYWIEGQLGAAPQGVTGPMVFGPDWLLEMLQCENGHTVGFYWARFSIIHEFPKLNNIIGARFVGFSRPGDPPAEWLTTSIVFDLGDVPLALTPEQLTPLIAEPRPHEVLDRLAHSSRLSRDARQIIAARYRDDVEIREVARELGVSHAHLSRQFKRDFGLTPISYLHRIRVSEAMSRLSRGESAIDIGYEVGFNDTGRFYKGFRKVTGTSPGKCRL